MAALFATGRIIDLILVLVALEAIVLLVFLRRRGHGPTPLSLVGNLASGACLMLAVRAALTGADWTVVAAFLLASFVVHITDLYLRFRDAQSEAVHRTSQSSAEGTSTETDTFNRRHKPGMIPF